MAYTAIVWENAAAALQHGMTVEVWFQEYRPPVLAAAGLIVFVSTGIQQEPLDRVYGGRKVDWPRPGYDMPSELRLAASSPRHPRPV